MGYLLRTPPDDPQWGEAVELTGLRRGRTNTASSTAASVDCMGESRLDEHSPGDEA